jgi:hypothetical protein
MFDEKENKPASPSSRFFSPWWRQRERVHPPNAEVFAAESQIRGGVKRPRSDTMLVVEPALKKDYTSLGGTEPYVNQHCPYHTSQCLHLSRRSRISLTRSLLRHFF